LASGAPPSPFATASGSSSSNLHPARVFRVIPLAGSAPLQSPVASSPPVPPVRRVRRKTSRSVRWTRDPPLLGFLLQCDATTPGAPFRQRPAEPVSWWARTASPSPVPSSGFLPLSTVLALRGACAPLARSVVFPEYPTLRGLVSCRSRPGMPFRAFPSRGAVPALAGLCSLAGSRSTAAGAAPRESRVAFPAAPTLCRGSPEGSPDAGAGNDGSLRHRPRSSCAPERVDRNLVHSRRRARRLTAGTPASELCSPRESVHARDRPWPGQDSAAGALLGFFPSKACSNEPRGLVTRRAGRGAGRTRVPRTSPEAWPLVPVTRSLLRPRALAPGIRRRAWSIEPRAPPSGSDSVGGAFAARRRPSPAPPGPDPPPLSGTSGPCERLARAPSRRRPAPPTLLIHCSPRRDQWTEPRRRAVGIRKWVPLLRDGPALLGFYPSSIRLVGARSRRRVAYTPFGP
jgi:hypothetical protein